MNKNIKKINVSNINDHLLEPIDLFITSSSFEDRCLTIPENLDISNIQEVLLVEHVNYHDFVKKNLGKLEKIFFGKYANVIVNTDYPLSIADNIFNSLSTSCIREGNKTILIDITTFTHESLLILLKILYLFYSSNNRILITYTSAEEYSLDNKLDDKWLSKGLAEVRSILGYSGELSAAGKTHLIILVGYESERASKLIESYEPNLISLGYGNSQGKISHKHYQANLSYKNLLEDTLATQKNVVDFSFSSSDPWQTTRCLLKLIQSNPYYNTVIAPMNTKLSTVGAFFLTQFLDSVQLCYSQPLQYNFKNYSKPSSMAYLLDITDSLKEKRNIKTESVVA